MKRALLIIDMLRDFSDGGSLAVRGTPDIVSMINTLQEIGGYGAIVLVQDWHPDGHCSFKIWPEHCKQGTPGADFVPGLETRLANLVLRKGTSKTVDSYSAFMDNDKVSSTGLDGCLRGLGIYNVDIVGVATDYCIRFTAEDALNLGYRVRIFSNCVKAVDPELGERVLDDLESRGAEVTLATIQTPVVG